MKIGLLTQWYAPEPGPAMLPEILARALTARGHDVSVLTGFPNYPSGRLTAGYRMHRKLDVTAPNGTHIRRVALYPNHGESGLRRFANYSSFAISASVSGLSVLRNTDAFWVYNSPATIGLPSAFASVANGPPHLLHVMDLWPDSIRFSGITSARTYRFTETLLRAWCNQTYRQAGAIACISQAVVHELTLRGVPSDKLHYVPVWTDEALFFPRERPVEIARALKVADSFVLMYAGNLGDAQGLEGLLDVCARVSDLANFRCLIVGSGVAEESLRQRARSNKLTNTTFLGRLPPDQMGTMLALGDVHLLSLGTDPLSEMTMPSKLPAILASGRAVLATARGEVARVVGQASTGWVVPPGDLDSFEQAVREAYAGGKSLAASYGRNARNYYTQHFSLAAGVDAIETLLCQLADGDISLSPSYHAKSEAL